MAALLASEREASNSITTYAVKNEEGQQMLYLILKQVNGQDYLFYFICDACFSMRNNVLVEIVGVRHS